jgi:hypothetical protein
MDANEREKQYLRDQIEKVRRDARIQEQEFERLCKEKEDRLIDAIVNAKIPWKFIPMSEDKDTVQSS